MTHDGQIMIAQAHYQMSQKWYVSVCVHVCVYLCVCVVPNIKLVKCKNGICLCVPVSVYVHVSVCGMPLINLVSLACLPMSQKV